LVQRAEALGTTLAELPLKEMQKIEPRLTAAAREILTVEKSVASRTSLGGTAPALVAAAAKTARARFLGKRKEAGKR
ncbi:MAG: argininosuccinate lyase, partial [Stellaceae bacterium]